MQSVVPRCGPAGRASRFWVRFRPPREASGPALIPQAAGALTGCLPFDS